MIGGENEISGVTFSGDTTKLVTLALGTPTEVALAGDITTGVALTGDTTTEVALDGVEGVGVISSCKWTSKLPFSGPFT